MTAKKDQESADGLGWRTASLKASGAPWFVPAHTLVTGFRAGRQAADLRTVTDPEKGQGHVGKVVLCASLLCLHDEATPLHVRAKSNPLGQESSEGHSRCSYFAGNALRVSNLVVNSCQDREDWRLLQCQPPLLMVPLPWAPSHCAALLGLGTSTPTSHAPCEEPSHTRALPPTGTERPISPPHLAFGV